jgi:hypothetical protein
MLNVPSQIVAVEGEGEDATYLHRLLDPGPRAWVVHQVQIIPGDDQAVERLSDERFAPFDTAILPEPLGAPLPGTVESAGASAVRWEIREPGHLQLEVDTPSDGLLVLGEVFYPGWLSYVDGKPAPMLRADLALRAVPVPAGQHRVEMIYRPWTVPVGIIISALTLGCVFAASWVLVKREQHIGDGSAEAQQTIASDGF